MAPDSQKFQELRKVVALDPAPERTLIREVVQEIIWNAETRSIRLSLDMAVLARGLGQALGTVMSVYRPAREYPR